MKTYKDYDIDIPFGRTSGKLKVFCPQCHATRHDKRDKSLSVDLDKRVWNCHYCGWAGGLLKDDPYQSRHGWFNPNPIRQEARTYKKPTPRPTAPISANAAKWFLSRGISPDTLISMKITEGLEYMPQKSREWNTVQFNYFLNGELVNTKFRTGDKCFKLVAGAQLLPYNIDAIADTPECVITEGEMDALSFIEAGRTDVISVPNGANSNLTYLDDFIDSHFDNKDTIYIAVDTDTKGVLLRDELLRRLGAERCRVVTYGEGCKDANEHLIKFGKESLLRCLADAPESDIEGVYSVGDVEQNLDALFEHGLQRGVTIGHPNLDKLLSLETKRLMVVTGIPGCGKSEFIDEIAERLNIRYGWRFAYFSPENAPIAYHASKLIEKFVGKRFGKDSMTYGEYRQAKEHLEQDFFFIAPAYDYKVGSILDRAKSLVRRKGIKALVIDPYNRIESEQGRDSETQYISRLLDQLTNFAQRFDVLVILMAHPTKMKRADNGRTEVPTLYDISGSAHFFNKCDFGIVVNRDRDMGCTEIRVQKVKFRHLGECGTATFRYNVSNGRYVPFENNMLEPFDNTNHINGQKRLQEDHSFASATFDFYSSTQETPF